MTQPRDTMEAQSVSLVGKGAGLVHSPKIKKMYLKENISLHNTVFLFFFNAIDSL